MKYVFARFHITLTVGRQGGVDPLRLFTLTVFEVRVAVTCGNMSTARRGHDLVWRVHTPVAGMDNSYTRSGIVPVRQSAECS